MPRRAFVAIDASNFKYFLWKQHWRIDWDKFKAYFERLYDYVNFNYYEGIRSKATFFAFNKIATIQDFEEAREKKLDFFKELKSKGFKVVKKLTMTVYDQTKGEMKHKCNFDVEITVDAIDKLNSYDDFILCSGDGDFVKLIRYLKGHKKKTIVIAGEERFSQFLINASNKKISLENIRPEIEKI